MHILFTLVIPFVLLNLGLSSIVLKIISAAKSGLRYWFKTSKK
jgi:uncharacterized membrane-anchored protein